MWAKINLILIILSFLSCNKTKLADLNFLTGTWKVVDNEQYEVWGTKDGMLSGYSYLLKDGRKNVRETLVIKQIDGKIVYEATVPDQNKGKTIQFVLNDKIKDIFSFENLTHDFPKKIQYKKLEENKLEVFVIGEGDDGFSLSFTRQ